MSTSLRDVVFDAPIQRAFSLLSEIMPYMPIMTIGRVFGQWVKTRIFVARRLDFSAAPSSYRSNLAEGEFVVRFLTNESEGR